MFPVVQQLGHGGAVIRAQNHRKDSEFALRSIQLKLWTFIRNTVVTISVYPASAHLIHTRCSKCFLYPIKGAVHPNYRIFYISNFYC
jgi:E3 ubiquitin-protein ligase DOA10